jgi:hypothetical protein
MEAAGRSGGGGEQGLGVLEVAVSEVWRQR